MRRINSAVSIGKGNRSAHDLHKLASTCWTVLGIDYMVAEQLLKPAMSKLDKEYIRIGNAETGSY